MKILFFISIFSSITFSEILLEEGDLIQFFGGTAPNSSYDNWLSHVTEGVVEPNYNDYGPDFLDIQKNGFGNHRKLNQNSSTLIYWESIFENFINGDLNQVDSLLLDSLESFFYEIVIFNDTITNDIYHIIREKLDSSYVDTNQSDNQLDDTFGGFNNSWGMYIINSNADRDQVIIQVPHPCDDFIAPYLALNIFIQTNSFAFMISSAGREVLWSEEGSYSNNKSYSDPSRYPFSVFQKFQEKVTEPLFDQEPHSPLVFAIHSFDNESHLERKSIILASGEDKSFTTKPIRDISDDNFDIINFTSEFPIIENQFGNHNSIHISDYYEAYYDDYCYYDNGNDSFEITLASELKGPRNGVQMIDLQSKVNEYSVYETWVHVEFDEKPALLDSLEIINNDTYSSDLYPVGVNNYSKILQYYQPFINALDEYLEDWENHNDQTPPSVPQILFSQNQDNPNQIKLSWTPSYDTNFKSYEIKISLDSSMYNPIFIDRDTYPDLQYMRKNELVLNGYNNTIPWFFQIRAIDHFNNISNWSVASTNSLPGHSPPTTLLSYDTNILFESYGDEDQDQFDYIIDTTQLMPDNNATLSLFGNSWKSIQINPTQIDSSTVLQIFVRIDSVSEIQGILFENSENKILRYSFSGIELLNIEDWIPVYQGAFQNATWNSYRLPIGDDWLSIYDSLDMISKITFVNDHDDTLTSPGGVHFSILRDITSDLHIFPSITIQSNNINTETINSRNTYSFSAIIDDIDSHFFTYSWDFGDGTYSNLENPTHVYDPDENSQYEVVLVVEDETGLKGWDSKSIVLDSINVNTPILTMNFIGDIMLGRRFEDDDGIITNQGADALFEPTYEILGYVADITVGNLEVPLTNHDIPHPTKGIVFKANPSNVNALVNAGIDVLSIANNHILDFMEPGLIQTQNVLRESGIIFSGAGLNSQEAYLPAFKSVNGTTISYIASSDRTGQYNNYQPYLNAGENKSGFAYMTPYYIRKQIESVKDISDLIVVEFHSGSEYSFEPGSNYDYYSTDRNDFARIKSNPASKIGFRMTSFDEEEDYSRRLDQPQMWDRAIRHFAIDEGADLVIVHHPHIIQGVEIYNGKLIAHSLGNFIFDLNYPETYPSMILNSKSNETGFYEYFITPLYIDDYLTMPASGELANYILNDIAYKSRKLNTYLHVNTDSKLAHVIMDTTTMISNNLNYNKLIINRGLSLINGIELYESIPIKLSEAGSLSRFLSSDVNIIYYRLGKERVWMNNFENEGSTLWNFNSQNEGTQDSIFRRGILAAQHKRYSDSPGNIVTNLDEKIPINKSLDHTLHGYIKTKNAKNVTLELRSSLNRTGEGLETISLRDSVNGNSPWRKYWENISIPENSEFFDIRLNSSVPDTGVGFSWFDDVGLIEWDSLIFFTSFPIEVIHPNNYNYIQIFTDQSSEIGNKIELQNTTFGTFSNLQSVPKVVNQVISIPDFFYFYDESKGSVGDKVWIFNEEIILNSDDPYFFCNEPGVYEVNLQVSGINNEVSESSITVVALEPNTVLSNLGDINGDGLISLLDLLLCSNSILGFTNLNPDQFLVADLDYNLKIDISDILKISDLFY